MLRQKSLCFLTNKQKGKAVGCQLKNKCLQDWVNCQPIVCYICITYSSQFGTATILVLYWWCGEETTIESGKLETWDPKNNTSWTSSDPNDLGWFNLHVICVKKIFMNPRCPFVDTISARISANFPTGKGLKDLSFLKCVGQIGDNK